MKPIQNPSSHRVAFPTSDASDKNPAVISEPAVPTGSERTEKKKKNQIAEAKVQGNLRSAELNSALNSLQPGKLEYPNITFNKNPKNENNTNNS